MSHSPNAPRSPGPEARSSSSTSLLQRAMAREPDAWERLADLYGPLVYRWGRQAGLQSEDAADMVQEVFRAVLTGLGQFRGQRAPGSFRAWLRTITRNKVCDHFRGQRGSPQAKGGTTAQEQLAQVPELPEPSYPGDPPEAEGPLWRRAMEAVRTDFEDRTWQAFWRVVVDGRSPAEVAAELGTNPDSVYQAKSRVLRRLRRDLAELEAFGNEP